MYLFRLLVPLCKRGNETLDEGSLLGSVAQVEVAGDTEGNSPDEVDEEVLHGVNKANVEVSTHSELLTVDHYFVDVPDNHDLLTACWVECNRTQGMDDRVLLHVHTEKHIHGKLKEFPDHPDGHGEAECHDGNKEGGKTDTEAFALVEDVHQREADGCGEKTVEGMQGGIPEGIGHVVSSHLSQDGSSKDEEEDDVLQGIGDVYAGVGLDEGGDGKEDEGKDTEKDVLITAVENLDDHDQDNYQTKQVVYNSGTVTFTDHLEEGLLVWFSQLFHDLYCGQWIGKYQDKLLERMSRTKFLHFPEKSLALP